MTSIRVRTLGLVLLVFGVSMLAIGLVSYRYAAHEIEELYDASLAQNARLLEGLIQAPLPDDQRDALLASLESALLRAEASDKRLAGHRYESKLAFQLWENGRLVLRSASAPPEPFTEAPPGYASSRVADHDWRVYVLDLPESQRVMVAERDDVRGELTRAVALRTLLPDLIGLPLLALLLWWATGWGLRPLSRLAAAIRQREPHNLQPLVMHPQPRELDTIVGALNRLLERICGLRVREKRFIADAAHELRTPLAVLDLHAQNALAAEAPLDRRESLEELRTGVARATRLVSQLLTLARLDPEEEAPTALPEANLLVEVREALAELSPLAIERHQTMDLIADEASDWRLAAEPGGIGILVQNLVGNALRHSPEDSLITVGLAAEGEQLTLRVDDQGPGIPAAKRERVVERFHRAGPGAGAGLGLSIVERLLRRHGGKLRLEEAPGGGLSAVATLPRRPSPGPKK